MKSYLDMIPRSARVRKRQNRMTILCITISVLLVTAIFSVTDMFLRSEGAALTEKHGSWHLQLSGISPELAESIGQRPDVTAIGLSESFNTDADKPWYLGERRAALYGSDETYLTRLTSSMQEGTVPETNQEVVLSANARLALQLEIGDTVTLSTPAGAHTFTITGFGSDDADYYDGQMFLVAAALTPEAFQAIMEENGITDRNPAYYVQFQSAAAAKKAEAELLETGLLTAEQISENTAVLGLSGQSSLESMKNLYGLAAVLFLLVLSAGVLMISGTLNSQIARRTQFFGMLRCIGASSRQILHLVRLEALHWCRMAVPAGMLLGTVVSWTVCGLLRFGIGGEFAAMPVFALSPTGLISGGAVGVGTVLLAAQAPAKRAAGVSPMAAVSGAGAKQTTTSRLLPFSFGPVEQALGIRHAFASKKNWLLMTLSLALSIVLFLCFSVGLDFAKALLPSMHSWQPDLVLNGYANARILDQKLSDTIRALPGVETVFGCSWLEAVPAVSEKEGARQMELVSYSPELLDLMEESVVQGSLEDIYGESRSVMVLKNKEQSLEVGDPITLNGKEVTVAAVLSSGPYTSGNSIVCSGETFAWLTGETSYSLLGVLLDETAGAETLLQINALADRDVVVSDLRTSNREDRSTYLATWLLCGSFLFILALIAFFHMLNSISMSVTARLRQYGAMRAVGMDSRQLTRMIGAEAFTYAISGFLVGTAAGIFLSRYLYERLLTRYFGVLWSLPVPSLLLIFLFCLASALTAIHRSAKRVREMTVTAVIQEL